MRTSGLKHVLCLGVTVASALSACTPKHSQQPSPTPEPPHRPVSIAEADSWSPKIMAGSQRFLIRDSSTVSISNDTTTQALPIESTMIYSIVITPSTDSFVLVGRVDSLTINSRLPTKRTSVDTGRAGEFRGTLIPHGQIQAVGQPQTTSCSSSSNSALTRIYELIVPFPKDKIRIGDKWSDTVSATTCHGKTPLTQQLIREFEVTGFNARQQQKLVMIQRKVFITFTGATTDTNTHLSASGSGSGEATLIVDQNSAELLQSDGRTQSTLTVTTSRGTFPFTQTTSTHITTN